MKSNVSDYLELAYSIYSDATANCVADVSDLRDLETIKSRVEKEGLSFLTITLPAFCSDLERCLSLGFVDPTCFRSFGKHGLIPSFLKGITGRLFDHETGRIKNEDSEETLGCPQREWHSNLVNAARQICRAFNKIEFPCSPERVSRALRTFASIEREFNDFGSRDSDPTSLGNEGDGSGSGYYSKSRFSEFASVSQVLWSNLCVTIDVMECVPKHGPGRTADRITGNQKYLWRRWHDRLEPYFPLLGCAYPIGAYESEELEIVTIVSQDDEQPVKVVPVPKTLKAPRIIAIEPCCMQYAQQGIRDVLYDRLESYWLTARHVNFRDQTVNQKLAMVGSKTGRLATIDLSDASDRVPHDLAMEMFRSNPDLSDAIEACRSTSAQLPDGTIISPLRKFASMGSALCFPIEAMYFYTICVVALLKKHNLPVTQRNIYNVTRDVHIYGDDIIVPSIYATEVLVYLQKYNCKVNTQKTFLTGKFRESCGVDAYDGELVTPTYIRKQRPENLQQASELISWVATANEFYLKGFWRTSSLMFKWVEKILGPLPYVSRNSSALGRVSYLGYRSVGRWNRKLQRFEVKSWVPRPVHRSDHVDGYAALAKSLKRLELTYRDDLKVPMVDPTISEARNLERSAQFRAVAIQRGWVPVH